MAKKKIENELKIISTPDNKPARGFQKGNSGRPKGAVAKVAPEFKQSVQRIMLNEIEELENDFNEMSKTSKWMVLLGLARFGFTTMSSVKMDADIKSDNKMEIVIRHVNKNEFDGGK